MKRKINNKGFTLVELLATVVILLAISTVAVTSISASIDRQNLKKDNALQELIISYGRLYINENINSTCTCVKVSTLISKYSLNSDSLKKSDGSSFDGNVDCTGGSCSYSNGSCGC